MGLFDLLASPFKETEKKTKYTLPAATPGQQFGETTLLDMLRGYGFGGQGQLAGTTTGLMQNLLGAGMGPTAGQTSFLEAQTAEYMKGLQTMLEDFQRRGMSQAQQSALARGIPLSDVARGQEANVGAEVARQLSQGYTQAKMSELQNKLQYPMQNLQLMAGLQEMYNRPYMQMLNQLAMSRIAGPRDVTQILPPGAPGTITGAGGALGSGGLFGQGGMFQAGSQEGRGWFGMSKGKGMF